MAASFLQESSSLLNWNHFMIVSPPSGFLNVGSALNGALTTIGNLLMGLGTFVWGVVSWLFQIALNPSFIMDPLFKDLAGVYHFAYQSFFLPLLPLLAAAVLLYSIYFYFKGNHAKMLRVFASAVLAILIVLIGFLELPVLFSIGDTLAIGTTSAVMGQLETTLSGGQITASNQAVSGLTNTYLQSPWELMQFGFLSSNPSQYGLNGGVTGTTFNTLTSNLNQVDPSVTSAVLQEQFSTPYPHLITVANPQATPGSGLPSTMILQGLATNVNGALVPDWRNVFYVYGGQNQESALARSFFLQGQQTVVGAANASSGSGNLDENHFFSGAGNLVLILIAMLTSGVPLAFALFTGAQLLWRELNFFFKLGQGIISLPFMMVPEAGPAHTKKWLGQAAGHLIERFGAGVYFAIAVGLGSLLQQGVTGLFAGNAETGMVVSMLFLAFWYLSAFIYREKLFSMTVHPLAATVAQHSGIAGRGYAQRLQQSEERKHAITEATKKERERREEERNHPKGAPQKRAKIIRPFQREQHTAQSSADRKEGRAPSRHSAGAVSPTQEATQRDSEGVRAVFPAEMMAHGLEATSIRRSEERRRDGDVPFIIASNTRAQSGGRAQEPRNDRSASSVIRYADAVAWAKGAGMLTHLSMKRGLGASDAQVSALMEQMARNGVIRRDRHGFWWAVVPASDEPVPDAAASNPIWGGAMPTNEAGLEQGDAQSESVTSVPNADAPQVGADSYDHAVATPFILARRLGVEDSAAAALLGRMQENGVVQRGVGQWWKAIPANHDAPERGAGAPSGVEPGHAAEAQGEESTPSAPDSSEGVSGTPPITIPAETRRDPASIGQGEPERITPHQQPVSPTDEPEASAFHQGTETANNQQAPIPQRPATQPPTASSVITNQQVGRVKQFTRKMGHAAVGAGQVAAKVAKSQPIRMAGATAGFGFRVTRGTTKLVFKGGAGATLATIRAMEWHADRIGTPPGNETFAHEFNRRMRNPSRLEKRTGRAVGYTRKYGAPVVKGAKAGTKQVEKGATVGARQINRIHAVRQTHETVRATGEMVKSKAKGMAKDWFLG